MSATVAKLPDSDPIMERLEDQLAWYERKSTTNQRAYKQIKIVEILAAAIIPFLAALRRTDIGMVTGGLGVLVTVLEGMLHLNQYQQNWINYRSICEALKHEKYTYLGNAHLTQMSPIRTHSWRNASSRWYRRSTLSGHRFSSTNLLDRRADEPRLWGSKKFAFTVIGRGTPN